ncbi:MAG: FmdB family transcriptional regulator [SAR202 cluster bacterium]|nr:FmdB family transcriptional regulator [SAR202 cluster bacterium]
MPRYDYRCENCREEFELVQTFAEAGKGSCPACSGAGQRVYHAVPVIYKGSGFYTTDYGRPKPPTESKNGSSSDSSSSSDSKPSDSSSSGDSKSSSDSKSDTTAMSSSDSSAKSSSESGSSASSTPASSS